MPTTTPPPAKEPAPPPRVVVIIPEQSIPQAGTSTVATSSTVTIIIPTVALGTTTLAVQNVPLLSGGIAHGGETVPISYLEVTNIGTSSAQLSGFWIEQTGSASTNSIVGLSTVDDKGGSRGSAEAAEGSTLFQNGMAFAPTNALFAPGQLRLFTIKAILAPSVTAYIGTQLMINVASVQTTATVSGNFPIRGTTWTVQQ